MPAGVCFPYLTAQQGPTPPPLPTLFLGFPLMLRPAARGVSPLDNHTTHRQEKKPETPSFFLASIPPPASFPRLTFPLSSPPPSCRVQSILVLHTNATPLLTLTHKQPFARASSPSAFSPLSLLYLRQLHHESELRTSFSHPPPCGFETNHPHAYALVSLSDPRSSPLLPPLPNPVPTPLSSHQ